MANASVEISGVAPAGAIAAPIYGPCVRQETLAISGSTATLATAITTTEQNAIGGVIVARIVTDDTACYVAIGTTPDPTAVTAAAATSARRYVPAGSEIALPIKVGEKVAVHS